MQNTKTTKCRYSWKPKYTAWPVDIWRQLPISNYSLPVIFFFILTSSNAGSKSANTKHWKQLLSKTLKQIDKGEEDKALKFCWWRQLIKRTLLCQFSLKFLPYGQWAIEIGPKLAANLKFDGLDSMQDAKQIFSDVAINCKLKILRI